MAGELNLKRGDAFYNDFYSRGGWRYSFLREYRWHRRHLVKKFGVRRGARALEIACGSGFHTNLLCRMGLDCAGVDRSAEGIRWAKEHYPKRAFHCCDFRAMPFERESFDLILARGFSFYHYDLQSDDAIDATQAILRHIKPGGLFVMMILTDLSGRREEGKVWHNTIGDYERHFALFGRRSLVDWADGMAICGLWNDHQAPPSDGSSPLRELDTDSNTRTGSCGNTCTDTRTDTHTDHGSVETPADWSPTAPPVSAAY